MFGSQLNILYDAHCLPTWPTLSAGGWWRIVTTEQENGDAKAHQA